MSSSQQNTKNNQPKSKQEEFMGAGMQKSMIYMGPLFTLMFSFQLPAALGFYWTVGYIFQIFQQMYINKTIRKEKESKKEVAGA